MEIPRGYLFMPTDEELLVFYLGRKSKGLPLPCDIVVDRDIYGVRDKAPWQVFSDEDPWKISKTRDKDGNIVKTEGTIYVFTTLMKASKNRIARTAGCGAWHAETALEKVLNDNGHVIGYKRMLCFQITNELGVMDGCESKGHWIMHEYSLCGTGNTDENGVEYVLCRIKRDDSKKTKKSRTVKNLEVASADDEVIVSKPAKRLRTKFVQEQKMDCDHSRAAPRTEVVSFLEELVVQEQTFTVGDDPDELMVEEFLALWDQEEMQGTEDVDDVIVPKPAKQIRTEFVQEQKMDCDIGVAPATEGVPFSEELLEVEKQGPYSPMHSDMVHGNFEDLDSLSSLLESEEQPSLGLDFDAYANNLLTPEVVPWSHVLASSTPMALDNSQDMAAGYIEEPVSLLETEEQPSFDLAFDAFGNNPLTPEAVTSGHVLASSAPVALDTYQDMVAGYIEEPVSLLESEVQQSFDLAFDAFGNNLFTPEDTSQEQFLTYLLEQDLPYQENLWSGEPNCFGVGLLV